MATVRAWGALATKKGRGAAPSTVARGPHAATRHQSARRRRRRRRRRSLLPRSAHSPHSPSRIDLAGTTQISGCGGWYGSGGRGGVMGGGSEEGRQGRVVGLEEKQEHRVGTGAASALRSREPPTTPSRRAASGTARATPPCADLGRWRPDPSCPRGSLARLPRAAATREEAESRI